MSENNPFAVGYGSESLLLKIQELMDGVEWSPDTLDAIAELLRSNGYQVREPQEPDIDDSVKCCPDCDTPNQFGELCPSCVRERQNVARGDDIPETIE